MATNREPSPPGQHLNSSSSIVEADDKTGSSAVPSDINGQVSQNETSKRSHTKTSKAIPDDADRPAKVRKVDDDDHEDASSHDADDGPTQDNDNGEGYVPTWKPDQAALGPIISAPAWLHPTPPISPLFPVAGTINDTDQPFSVLERWVHGQQHNKLQVFALAPTEIWVEIIRQCDNMTIWNLRNSCRVMMTLCEEAIPSLRGRWGVPRPYATIKERFTPRELINYRSEMKARLNKQQFCQPCQEHRKKWAAEIYPAWRWWGLDIQHLGSVPVCEHMSIKAKNLEHWWSLKPTKPFRITCGHKTHEKYCEPSGKPSITVCTVSDGPAKILDTAVDVEWEAAIVTLSCDENGMPVERLSYTVLRDMIWAEASKADSGLPRLLCPHLSWNDHSLLRAFDPTVCSCLDAGNVPMYEVQQRHDPAYCELHRIARKCCLCQMAKGGKAGVFLPEGKVGGQYVPHDACCTDCSTKFTWTRRLDQETKKWRLWLNMKCRINNRNPMSSSWHRRIDPSTFAQNFSKHEDWKHRSWCDDAGCATSYRGRRRAKLLRIDGVSYMTGC